MFKNTLDNKRYYTLNCFFRRKFGSKVFKVPLDAKMSCPNKLSGGCIYCKDNSLSNIVDSSKDIFGQFEDAKKVLLKKWDTDKYIAYFQSGTNTYADVNILRKLYYDALSIPGVIGLSIATRPDSINEECMDLLKEINSKTFLTVEIGLQSSNENTLKLINRGHDVKCFIKCIERLKNNNIFTVVHVINGLPFETHDDMINTIKLVNSLGVDGIKIHMLYISKDTPLEKLYNDTHFKMLSKSEYIELVSEELTYLNPDMVIERITGDPIEAELIEPKWLMKKFCLLNDIDKYMKENDIYQGDNVK